METIDTRSLIVFNYAIMSFKGHVVYDLHLERFKHLKRDENKRSHRVDINDLNKKLNENKKNNLYTTVLFVFFGAACLVALTLISIKF